MPRIYRDILAENGVATAPVLLPSLFQQVPGGIILTRPGVRDIGTLFQEFCTYFHAPGHWTWVGGPVTPSRGQILDGVANRGQCAALANAFQFLATRALPYGLGISEATVPSSVTYSGQHGEGFVSAHIDAVGTPTVLGLDANVYAPPVPQGTFTPVTALTPLQPLYLWSNHKVVPVGAQFYDVMYNRIWANLAQMATYHIQGQPIQRRETNPVNDRIIVTEYLMATALGQVRYFRSFTDSEVNVMGRLGYQGPFNALPGQDWDGPTQGNVAAIMRFKFNKK